MVSAQAGKGGGSVVVKGALQVATELVVPAESPVPPHPYAHVCFGPLETTPENSCIGCPLVPLGAGTRHCVHTFPHGPCVLWAALGNSCIGTHQVSW